MYNVALPLRLPRYEDLQVDDRSARINGLQARDVLLTDALTHIVTQMRTLLRGLKAGRVYSTCRLAGGLVALRSQHRPCETTPRGTKLSAAAPQTACKGMSWSELESLLASKMSEAGARAASVRCRAMCKLPSLCKSLGILSYHHHRSCRANTTGILAYHHHRRN